MNRAERRKQPKQTHKQYLQSMPIVEIVESITPKGVILEGSTFTIAGHKRLPSGRWITNCRPGEETVMRAGKTIKQPAIPPAIQDLVDLIG